jgi:phage shock protein A
MSTFSRLRYVVAANVNALIEKAEDPEKLLRALIREMEDAGEEARMASAELLAEQQRLARAEGQLTEDVSQWQQRAETAVAQGRDDLARDALRARTDIKARLEATRDEQKHVADRVTRMEQDMATLKSKLAEAKTKLKALQVPQQARRAAAAGAKQVTPGERKARRAMERFDHLQAQVDNLEARVRSYDVGGPAATVWKEPGSGSADPAIEAELEQIKQRLAPAKPAETPQTTPRLQETQA